jgi:hypothetical protein
MTMLDEMEKNQKFVPDYGYTAPKRTRKECENPAFMDKNLHRVGYFKTAYHEDAMAGYSAVAKCVNCGIEFNDDRRFVPCKKAEAIHAKEAESK